MNKKLLLGIVFILSLVMITSVSASIDLTDGLVSYWKFDETSGTTASDSHGENDGDVTGATWTTGKINNGLDFTGGNHYVNVGMKSFGSSFHTSTLSFWIKTSHSTGTERITSSYNSGSTDLSYDISINNNELQIYSRDTNGKRLLGYIDFSDYTNDVWHHVVVVLEWDSNNVDIYVNNDSKTITYETQESPTSSADFDFDLTIGARNLRGTIDSFYNGLLDEVAIYDRALSSDEVSELYNSGDGLQYPFITESLNTPQIEGNTITINDTLYYNGIINISSEYDGFENISCEYTLNDGTDWYSVDNNSTHCYKNSLEPNTDIEIKFRGQEDGEGTYYESELLSANYFENSQITFNAYDVFNNEITDFNVTIGATTKNNTEEWNLNEGTYTATFSKTNWFDNTINITVEEFDITTYNFTDLYQTIIDFEAFEIITEEEIIDFNITIGSETKNNSEVFYLIEDSYTAIFSNSNYYNLSLNFNTTPLEIKTLNFIDVYDTILNLTFEDIFNSTLINNIQGTITYNGSEFIINNASQEYNLKKDLNYTISVSATGYATPDDYYILMNETYIDLTRELYPHPSILDIYIYKISDGTIVTEEITVQIIGETVSKTNITSSGNAYVDDLPTGYYNLRFISSDYTTADYQQFVGLNTYHNISVYLFDSAEDVVTFITKDQITGTPLEGVSYTISTLVNNTQQLIGSKFTDLSGQVVFNYETDKIYLFSVSKSGYESKSFQLGPTLNPFYNVWLDQTTTFNLTEAGAGVNINYLINPYLGANGISYFGTRFENNKTNEFRITFNSPNGELLEYCYNLTFNEQFIEKCGTNSYGSMMIGNISIENADVFDKVVLEYYYISAVTGQHNYIKEFLVSGEPSAGLLSNLRNERYGLGMMERILLVIFVAAIFGGLIGLFSGFLAGAGSIMFIFGYFLYMGFIEVYFVALPLILLFVYLIRGGDT